MQVVAVWTHEFTLQCIPLKGYIRINIMFQSKFRVKNSGKLLYFFRYSVNLLFRVSSV